MDASKQCFVAHPEGASTNIGWQASLGLLDTIGLHWPEFLMEAGGVALLMIAKCVIGLLPDHPTSPIHRSIMSAVGRRFLTGMQGFLKSRICDSNSPSNRAS